MPISILDYVKSKVGEKDTYPAADFLDNGVEIIGGCESCHATIAAYNAYPSTSGYWRCADCIEDTGFGSVKEFDEFCAALVGVFCPGCGSDHICEYAEDHFRCETCEAEWTT